MCGILGSIPSVNNTTFQQGLNMIAQRGPDGTGIWSDESYVQLGHTRLSIIDLSEAASQPFHFLNLTLVFNGEVYNYVEVRTELQKLGYKFTTTSDSEVLIKAYHCWGQSCLSKFNGMWAFAIYNCESKEVFIARDRYGVKPLYFYHKNGQFYFGSEIKAIHKLLGLSHPFNQEPLINLIQGRFDWHGGRNTWLQNVSILPAGCILKIKNGELKEERWYELKQQIVPKQFDEQAALLRSLLMDACSIRLRSDVPIGTCLSGGLDSSSIATVINSHQGNYTHRSFCASFPNTPIDESEKASKLASGLNLDLDIISISTPTISELEESMSQCDGPMHSLAFFPIWKLYKHIKSAGIKVTLDGQGPDEMLGGYRPIAPALKYAFRKIDPLYAWDIFDTYRNQGETEQFSSKQIAKSAFKQTLIEELKNLLKFQFKDKDFNHPFRKNILEEELYRQFFISPLPGILQQYDRCSMAHGIECRMPFMDYRIVELIFSLPIKSKIGNGYTKRVLREAMKGIVPDEIRLDKTKIGFNAPIVNWFNGTLKEWMLDIMSSGDFINADYFEAKKIKSEFEKFVSHSHPQWDDAWKFWGPVHYAWWKSNLNRACN